MRTVVPSGEIAHLWAHKAQPEARNSTGSFYFNGDTIYSYGSHFPIARHVTNKRGQAGILFTLAEHSVTTAGHMHAVRQAIRNHPATVLMVPKVPLFSTHVPETLGYFDRWIGSNRGELFGPTGRPRPKEWASLETLIGHANAYAAFFGSRRRWTMPATHGAARDAIVKAQRAADAKRRAQDREAQRRAAEDLAVALSNLETWRNGGELYRYQLPDSPVALRLRGDQVETSLGARVPLDHARLGLRFVRKCRDTATPYQRNGHTLHLGPYAIDSVDEHGNLRAGCHSITIDEIERIAPLLEA